MSIASLRHIGALPVAARRAEGTERSVSPVATFITPSLSILLDLFRGLAAVAVLVGHAVALKIYTGPFPFSEMLQHNAVIVFFVLSGLVISSSVRRNDYVFSEYFIARMSRILPVSIPALIFAAGCFTIGQALGVPNFGAMHYDSLSLRSVLMPLFFLSETAYGVGPAWNQPYWSLCYEESYYVLFGCAMLLRGPKRAIWCAAIAIIAGAKILLLAPIWLVGVSLTYFGNARPVSLRAGIGCVAVAAAALPLITHFSWHGSEWALAVIGRTVADTAPSQFFVTDYALGLAIGLGFIGARPIAERFHPMLRRLERPIRALAGCTFTLYLFHWPLFSLMRALGWTCGQNALSFVVVLASTIAASALLARVTEHRRGAVRHFLSRLFVRSQRMSPAILAKSG
ncbi:MAG: Acyltransferase family protein [Novosphingobium sp.]|nr:Acyltransferase family protein [Novosphingobium sp.]